MIPIRPLTAFAVILWLFAVSVGAWWVSAYANSPGHEAVAGPRWPETSVFAPEDGRFTLLMFVHPHCPCTRSSLAELEHVLARALGRVSARVVVVLPPGAPADWQHGMIRRNAETIPGVQVVIDIDGVEADRFGARTSGQVLLYGSDRRLVFRGGITAGRGHQGDNPGRQAVLAWVGGSGHEEVPVFGCPLGAKGGPGWR